MVSSSNTIDPKISVTLLIIKLLLHKYENGKGIFGEVRHDALVVEKYSF